MPRFKKYKLEVAEKFKVEKTGGMSYFDDLDSDGESEYIITFENIVNELSLKVMSKDNYTVNQWNVGRPGPLRKHISPIFTGDYNKDGYKEIFAMSCEKDSIFLDIISPLKKAGLERRNIFIDTIAPFYDHTDASVSIERLFDINRDGFKDLIIKIYAGFSLQPRCEYVYDIENDTLLRTPDKGVVLGFLKIVDINHDGHYELTGNTSGPGNIRPEFNIPYPDSSSWLMVLKDDLDYLFEPVEFYAYPSDVDVIPGYFRGDSTLLVYFENEGIMPLEDCLCIFDTRGNRIYEKSLEEKLILIQIEDKDFYDEIYARDEENNIIRIDGEDLGFHIVNKIEGIENGKEFDIDEDGKPEYVGLTVQRKELLVTRTAFKDPARIALPEIEDHFTFFGMRERKNEPDQIFVQIGSSCFLFNYFKNPWFQYLILIYFGIWFMVWAFIALMRRLYRQQLIRQQTIKGEIAKLQYNSINNQINPHFIFNAMNSITSAIYKENKEEAYRFGTKFSNLMRESLMSSDSISRSLEKELDFVKDYLDLEKFRFKDAFDYQFEIGPEVNLQTEVPKMIVQTFVENAVKHGMKTITGKGLIQIRINKQDKSLLIEVEDNGIGMEKAYERNPDSTSRGLGIVSQIFDLYKRLKGVEINYSIIDLKDNHSNAKGTLVKLELPLIC
ncbi:MAG: histidine kinase [Bacteroidales bacterium]|nr:histidine kinase [Bacteroidales bacterium]MCF8397157.1 histidine kinase [Bacteroidales bacterium]